MATVALIDTILNDLVEMTNEFAGVAAGEGLAPLLVLAGAIIMVVSIGTFTILTLGGIASLFSFD